MARRTYTNEQRARAVELYTEHGARATARILASQGFHVPASTVQAWASKRGERIRTLEKRTLGVQAQILEWQERRTDEANRAGQRAEELGALLMEHAHAGNHDMVKALVPAYGVMVDKAQLLSGGATGRDEHLRAGAAHLRDVTVARVRELREVAAS
jgi:transposase-like protein